MAVLVAIAVVWSLLLGWQLRRLRQERTARGDATIDPASLDAIVDVAPDAGHGGHHGGGHGGHF
jgi:hypothetical protein